MNNKDKKNSFLFGSKLYLSSNIPIKNITKEPKVNTKNSLPVSKILLLKEKFLEINKSTIIKRIKIKKINIPPTGEEMTLCNFLFLSG
jgi:hypothetical protein